MQAQRLMLSRSADLKQSIRRPEATMLDIDFNNSDEDIKQFWKILE